MPYEGGTTCGCLRIRIKYSHIPIFWMWRISSVIILVVPFWLVVYCVQLRFISSELSIWVTRMTNVLAIPFLLFSLYILARVVLIVLAFTLLRDLPKAAFQDVVWAKYIPHI